MAQSWHSPRVSFIPFLLLLAANDLILWCIDFFRVLFFFLISIHSDPCFNYHRSKSPAFQFLLLWELKNKDSIYNCFSFAAWLIRFINILYGEPNSHRTSLIKKSNCYADYRHSSWTLKSIVLRVISNLVHSFRKQLCFLVLSEYYNFYVRERLTYGYFKNLLSKSIAAITLLTYLPTHLTTKKKKSFQCCEIFSVLQSRFWLDISE